MKQLEFSKCPNTRKNKYKPIIYCETFLKNHERRIVHVIIQYPESSQTKVICENIEWLNQINRSIIIR